MRKTLGILTVKSQMFFLIRPFDSTGLQRWVGKDAN